MIILLFKHGCLNTHLCLRHLCTGEKVEFAVVGGWMKPILRSLVKTRITRGRLPEIIYGMRISKLEGVNN